ncbi:hypothetical protein CHS0354_040735 [Potamilus streckersoni]|uniref:Aromatic-L-amino-acid decarboxylase n=1 Tax=Potamilus streckersoni TaxID=2493646 RepID=A0AAE0SL59_9BIVA|nr:hypothetical protein CHS0354_040735 [Potamilus streckersoni]
MNDLLTLITKRNKKKKRYSFPIHSNRKCLNLLTQLCASLGTTGSCAFDNLEELGPICELLIKDSTHLVDAFNVDPIYLRHSCEGKLPDYRHCRLAKEFEKMILEDGRFEVVTKVVMGLVCFRLKCSNKVTERLLDEILKDGRIYLIPAFVRNIYFLRLAICAERTTSDDIKFSFQVIKSCTDRLLQKVSLKNGYKHVPVIDIDAPQNLETEEHKYSSDSSTPDVDQ